MARSSGRAFLGKEQAQDSEMWSEEDFAGWIKGRKGKKRLSQSNDCFQKSVFRPYQPDKGGSKDYSQNKGKGWFLGLQLLDGKERKPTLLGWRYPLWILPTIRHTWFWIWAVSAAERFQKHSWYFGTTTQFCRCNKSCVFANSETETCLKSCIIHFPTTPPCSTMVDVLEPSDVLFLFSLPQMRNMGMLVDLDPQRDKITCPAFGLFSSPAEYSTLGHVV